jgi:hypothetical protein
MRTLLPMLVAAWCAAPAVAQTTTRSTTTVSYHRVSTLVGTTFSLGTTTVGKVTEVVFNDGGCIEYLVVQEADGFVVVPWSIATVNYEQRTVTVQSTTVTVDRLRELRFTGDRWPNFADQAYAQRVQSVWGASAGRSGSAERGAADRKGTERKEADRKGSGTTDPERKGADPRAIPPTDPKGREKPSDPPTKDPGRADPPAKGSPKKDDPEKERPEKEKEKKDPGRS